MLHNKTLNDPALTIYINDRPELNSLISGKANKANKNAILAVKNSLNSIINMIASVDTIGSVNAKHGHNTPLLETNLNLESDNETFLGHNATKEKNVLTHFNTILNTTGDTNFYFKHSANKKGTNTPKGKNKHCESNSNITMLKSGDMIFIAYYTTPCHGTDCYSTMELANYIVLLNKGKAAAIVDCSFTRLFPLFPLFDIRVSTVDTKTPYEKNDGQTLCGFPLGEIAGTGIKKLATMISICKTLTSEKITTIQYFTKLIWLIVSTMRELAQLNENVWNIVETKESKLAGKQKNEEGGSNLDDLDEWDMISAPEDEYKNINIEQDFVCPDGGDSNSDSSGLIHKVEKLSNLLNTLRLNENTPIQNAFTLSGDFNDGIFFIDYKQCEIDSSHYVLRFKNREEQTLSLDHSGNVKLNKSPWFCENSAELLRNLKKIHSNISKTIKKLFDGDSQTSADICLSLQQCNWVVNFFHAYGFINMDPTLCMGGHLTEIGKNDTTQNCSSLQHLPTLLSVLECFRLAPFNNYYVNEELIKQLPEKISTTMPLKNKSFADDATIPKLWFIEVAKLFQSVGQLKKSSLLLQNIHCVFNLLCYHFTNDCENLVGVTKSLDEEIQTFRVKVKNSKSKSNITVTSSNLSSSHEQVFKEIKEFNDMFKLYRDIRRATKKTKKKDSNKLCIDEESYSNISEKICDYGTLTTSVSNTTPVSKITKPPTSNIKVKIATACKKILEENFVAASNDDKKKKKQKDSENTLLFFNEEKNHLPTDQTNQIPEIEVKLY